MSFLTLITILSLTLLYYVFDGYLRVLRILSFFLHKKKTSFKKKNDNQPRITIFLSALNEEKNIIKRIENIYTSNYPHEKIILFIVSDGSSDNTEILIKNYINNNPSKKIKFKHWQKNKGQAAAQNYVATHSETEILISTDADSNFTSDTIQKLVEPLLDEKIGVVGGVIHYLSSGDSSIASSYSKYRKMEFELRKLESLLKIGVQTDGPCLAFKKKIWSPIREYEDIDQIAPMLAKKHGLLTVQAEDAICYDLANDNTAKELKQRRRMTRKGLLSRFSRWGFSDIIKNPGFSYALYSHKILRYFSPFYLLAFIISLFFLIIGSNNSFIYISLILILFTTLIFLALLKVEFAKKTVKILYTFTISQYAFLLGILDWIKGDKSGKYKPTNS